jgi:two-component system sensor histidine kinase RegB
MARGQLATILTRSRGGRLEARLGATARSLQRLVKLLGLTQGSPGRLRLHTLTVMRWIAVIGQLFTILFVHFSLGIELPLLAMLPAVALSALINILLMRGLSLATRLSERGATVLFAYDIIQLCWLLSLSGGLINPFALLILLPVAVAAATFGFASMLAITVLALAGTTVLALVQTGLPWRGGTIELPALYVLGIWTGLSTAILLIALFVWNIAEEARRYGDALAATQAALDREQRLSALGGQAAAAAHMLGSPLATINVIAKELVHELPEDDALQEEVRTLLSQVQRCREILATLGRRPADHGDHRRFTAAPLSTLLETIAQEVARPQIAIKVRSRLRGEEQEPELALDPALRHALANLIDNAVQFARSTVTITSDVSPRGLEVLIEDDGPGFSPEILDWLGEPYTSTRQDKGGLGLGVFIANTLLARTGATLTFSNNERGARVAISWSRPALDQLIEE